MQRLFAIPEKASLSPFTCVWSLLWDWSICQNAHIWLSGLCSKTCTICSEAYICVSSGFCLDLLQAEAEGEGAPGQSAVKLKVSGWGFVYPTNQFGCKLDLKSCPRPPWASPAAHKALFSASQAPWLPSEDRGQSASGLRPETNTPTGIIFPPNQFNLTHINLQMCSLREVMNIRAYQSKCDLWVYIVVNV